MSRIILIAALLCLIVSFSQAELNKFDRVHENQQELKDSCYAKCNSCCVGNGYSKMVDSYRLKCVCTSPDEESDEPFENGSVCQEVCWDEYFINVKP